MGIRSASSGSSGDTSTRNYNRFGALADQEDLELESSDTTTVVLPVPEILVQVPDQPAIVRTQSNESHDDSHGLGEVPINESRAPTQGEQGKQDFHKASSE